MLQATRTMRATTAVVTTSPASSTSSPSQQHYPSGRPSVAAAFRAMTLGQPSSAAQPPQHPAKPALRIETTAAAATETTVKKGWSWRLRRNSKAAAAITGACPGAGCFLVPLSVDFSRLTSPNFDLAPASLCRP